MSSHCLEGEGEELTVYDVSRSYTICLNTMQHTCISH